MRKNRKNRKQKTEIIIGESILYWLIETIGFYLHFIALFLGLAALIGISLELNHEVEIALETATLVVISLILIHHLLKPFIQRIMIKHTLHNFWSKTEITNDYYYPNSIKREPINGDIDIQMRHVKTKDVVDIHFSKGKIFKRSELIVEYTPSEIFSGIINWDIERIYIDVKKSRLEINARFDNQTNIRMHINEDNQFDFKFVIDLKEKRAFWTGNSNSNLAFGEWSWK